jgi:hypothetical protein
MITKFKIFEKLGVNQITFDIADRAWDQIKDQIKYNNVNVKVNISDFNLSVIKNTSGELGKVENLDIYIRSNINTSSMNALLDINNNIKIFLGTKDVDDIKNKLIHEIKHLIDSALKSKILSKRGTFYDNTKRFFNGADFTHLLIDEIRNNNDGKICSISDFMLKKYNGSDTFRNFLIYCYLGNDDELSARFQEFANKVKTSKNLLNIIKSEENIHPLKYYKQMVNFTFDFNKLTKYEKSKILGRIDKKNIKKVETYIRQQGQKFIKKIHKLAYFQQEQ